MKILLVEAAEYLYSYGGANKANRLLVEWMAMNGHQCVVVNVKNKNTDFSTYDYLQEHQGDKNLEVIELTEEIAHFRLNHVEDYTVMEGIRTVSVLRTVMKDYEPELVLVSDDYPFFLLRTVLEFDAKIVFIAHCQATLSFGPESYEKDEIMTKSFTQLDGIIVVSDYLGKYFKKWAGIDTKRIYFPSYGEGPFSNLANYDNPYVTVINPSLLKGFTIFIEMAKCMKEVQFAAIPTWATSNEEIEIMNGIDNITVLDPVDDVNEIYAKTKVFLMPSLWGEALGQVVIEALLRGIPVIASNVGGLPEAMLGLDYLLPVNPIEEYMVDEQIKEKTLAPIIPEQNWGIWVETLRKCLSNREEYMELSTRCYHTAKQFHETISFRGFEEYFKEIVAKQNINEERSQKLEKIKKSQERLKTLSSNKKEQLAALLRQRRGVSEKNE